MAIVAGVDFGTLSVRVSIVDSELGMLGSAISEYPLHRTRNQFAQGERASQDNKQILCLDFLHNC